MKDPEKSLTKSVIFSLNISNHSMNRKLKASWLAPVNAAAVEYPAKCVTESDIFVQKTRSERSEVIYIIPDPRTFRLKNLSPIHQPSCHLFSHPGG
jgi:hypothetical protein